MKYASFSAFAIGNFALILGLVVPVHGAIAAETWTVESVLGGHSMKLVRGEESQLAVLHGVKAPKLDTPEGDVAKQFLEELVLDFPVAINVVRESRGMNYVTAELEDGTDPAAVLLQYGLVEWDHILAPDASEYAAIQADAQANKLGLWGDALPQPESEGRTYTLRSDADGSREALVSEDGTTILRMKGNEVPNYEVRANASQEKHRRAEERRLFLEEQARLREEAIRQQQMAAAQADAQARQDYLYYLDAQNQRLLNQNLYLNNEAWRRRLYGNTYIYPYPYSHSFTYSGTQSTSGTSSGSSSHGSSHSPFLNVHVNHGGSEASP